jgi:hypothetical protein
VRTPRVFGNMSARSTSGGLTARSRYAIRENLFFPSN